MRYKILILIFLLVIALIQIAHATEINCAVGGEEEFAQCEEEHGTCFESSSSEGEKLICWVEGEAPEKPIQPPEQQLPEGLILNIQQLPEGPIVFSLQTENNEKADLILELIDERVGNDIIKKPRLNLNLDIKNLNKIPTNPDVRVTPYNLYTILVLLAASLLLVLSIIKDYLEPNWEF